MDQISLIDIKNWIKDVRNILIGLNICINNGTHLVNEKYPINIRYSGFLNQYLKQQKFIASIELSKLLSSKKGDKRSFKKLFNKLKNLNYDDELNSWLGNDSILGPEVKSKKEIIFLIENLEQKIERQQTLITKVINIRDTFYAHQDEIIDEIILTMHELSILTQLSSDIFNEINSKLFRTTTLVDLVSDWSIENILILMKD